MNKSFGDPEWVIFQNRIGYTFSDIKLLYHAMTHSSFANEKKLPKYENNERLEFLGDAVLELVSSYFLYKTRSFDTEGSLTKLRASLVCEPTLAEDARSIDLPDFILLGKGEELTGGRSRDSVTSDALEALIGAIYLDGGFESAKLFIIKFILNDIENKKLFNDSKTVLQEFAQAAGFKPEYELISESGPDHCKEFTVSVKIDGKIMGKGSGNSKKNAEQKAAYAAIKTIKEQNLCS